MNRKAWDMVLCVALAGFGGCGDSNTSAADSSTTGSCTISRTATTIVTKVHSEGQSSTTVYIFDAQGEMTSSTVSIRFDGIDETTAKAACNTSSSNDDVEIVFEDGYCVTTTNGGFGNIDDIYEAQQTMCANLDKASKPGGSSSSKGGSGGKNEVADLAALFQLPCSEKTEGRSAYVKSEKTDYVCAPVSLGVVSSYQWAPVVSSISDMDDCSQSFATANPKKTYVYAKDDKQVYSCSIDAETLDWAWQKLGEAIDLDDDDDDGGNTGKSSSSTGKSSSSVYKGVTFADGVIWQPSYQGRARTFFNTVEEKSFLEEAAVTKDYSGWWYVFDDSADEGTSIAEFEVTASRVSVDIILQYKEWYEASDGVYTYWAPNPYPYAALGFDWAPVKGQTVDLTTKMDGICVTYDSKSKFEIVFKSSKDGSTSWYYAAPEASNKKTVNISFSSGSSLKQPSWAVEQGVSYPTLANALANAEGLHFKYSNDEANVSCDEKYSISCYTTRSTQINIYKIGLYGTCE